MAAVAATVLRVFLNAGHGLSNSTPGAFDPGAVSDCGGEHEIVSRITDNVVDRFSRNEKAAFTVVETPRCSSPCLKKHPKYSHLGYTIAYVNDNLRRDAKGRVAGEVVLSVHMNSSSNRDATGVEVLYSATAPKVRKEIAAKMSAAVAATLGLRNRGAKADINANGKHVAILRNTDCPAYLIELGFVSNPQDVLKVRECGVDAVMAALEVIAKEHS